MGIPQVDQASAKSTQATVEEVKEPEADGNADADGEDEESSYYDDEEESEQEEAEDEEGK